MVEVYAMATRHFPAARWGIFVRIATLLTYFLLAVMMTIGLTTGPRGFWVWQAAMVWLPLAVMA